MRTVSLEGIWLVHFLLLAAFTFVGYTKYLDDGFDEFGLRTLAIGAISLITLNFVVPLLCYALTWFFIEKGVKSNLSLFGAYSFMLIFMLIVGTMTLAKAKNEFEGFDIFEEPKNEFEEGVSKTVLASFVSCCDGANLFTLSQVTCEAVPEFPCFNVEDSQEMIDLIEKIGGQNSDVCKVLKGIGSDILLELNCRNIEQFAEFAKEQFENDIVWTGTFVTGISGSYLGLVILIMLVMFFLKMLPESSPESKEDKPVYFPETEVIVEEAVEGNNKKE